MNATEFLAELNTPVTAELTTAEEVIKRYSRLDEFLKSPALAKLFNEVSLHAWEFSTNGNEDVDFNVYVTASKEHIEEKGIVDIRLMVESNHTNSDIVATVLFYLNPDISLSWHINGADFTTKTGLYNAFLGQFLGIDHFNVNGDENYPVQYANVDWDKLLEISMVFGEFLAFVQEFNSGQSK